VLRYLSDHLADDAVLCLHALPELAQLITGDAHSRRALAYVLAWLGVAGGDSILPAWVRHEHDSIGGILDALRNTPCDDPSCRYCRLHHHPRHLLQRFFAYDDFRRFGDDQQPVQENIVTALMAKQATLAVLPTGGGKSLCYQIPAMMLAINRGLLTLVLSPLQSLMNDQVSQLAARNYPYSAALHGGLTMPERARLLDDIRLGRIHLLYIAPEQLRNRSFMRAIASREVGQWIIDEAHCLSKWGHDFRPDYLYIARFIAKHTPQVPVHCFTATARCDVVAEIRSYMQQHLGYDMQVISAGHKRKNLHYRVLPCPPDQKREKVLALLYPLLRDDAQAAAIVFCSRRRLCEEMAAFLQQNHLDAAYFHAGMNPRDKLDTQQAFMTGAVRVMAATCAFGMGVDKSNVRLVIHAQMPDSLENYLQESGRAGRDGAAAECVLLYDEKDAQKQFSMRAQQQISFNDFKALFQGIRQRVRKAEKRGGDVSEFTVIASSGDILRSSEETSFDQRDHQYDTKVRTAIAWMEEAGLIERRENHSSVLEGGFLVPTLEAIRQRLREQKLSESKLQRLLTVARAVMQFGDDDVINIDGVTDATGLESREVLAAIHALQEAGVMNHDMTLVAWLKAGVAGDSRSLLQALKQREQAFFELLCEQSEGDEAANFQMNLSYACAMLREAGEAQINPHQLRLLLAIWLKLDHILVTIRQTGRDQLRLQWRHDFSTIREQILRRQHGYDAVLNYLQQQIPAGERGLLQVSFGMNAVIDALRQDAYCSCYEKPEQFTERAMLGMQRAEVMGLENGAALFHSAMGLHIPKHTRIPRRKDFAPLADHYQEQIHQVHVMRAWAVAMAEQQQAVADRLLSDYFDLPSQQLMERHFPDQTMFDTAASALRVEQLLAALSPAQQDVVKADAQRNILLLAGPGSGKTRVLVYRLAWLISVQQQAAASVLVVAFNRSAVNTIRQRLAEPALLGGSAWQVQVHTYHSLAMQLIGDVPPDDSAAFESWSASLMTRAIALLQATEGLDGSDSLRSHLLRGFSHIFVDEYQDINDEQYTLLSLLAGRISQGDDDKPLTMFAVGDDDQNIYDFQGSSNVFIQQFKDDYDADCTFLTENYRAIPAIVALSNQFIAQHPNRLKAEHPIVAVKKPEGDLERARLFRGNQAALQHKALEICRYLLRKQADEPHQIAVLCRNHAQYHGLAQRLRAAGIPVCEHQRKPAFAWHRLREVATMLQAIPSGEAFSANDIATCWQALPETVRQHGRCQVLWQWLAQYGEEERDIRRHRREWQGEWFDELRQYQGQQQQGIQLMSMHAAKGLEFNTVILFSSDDRRNTLSDSERRLLYVAMTRARVRLMLMQSSLPYGHGRCFEGLGLEPEDVADMAVAEQGAQQDVWYCGMADVVLGYGGWQSQPLPVLQEGDVLQVSKDGGFYYGHRCVATLSKKGRDAYQNMWAQGWQLQQCNIHAICQRHRREEQGKQTYRQTSWDIILPALYWQQSCYG
jgi:ATP-dependent DNA helicase RecQ